MSVWIGVGVWVAIMGYFYAAEGPPDDLEDLAFTAFVTAGIAGAVGGIFHAMAGV